MLNYPGKMKRKATAQPQDDNILSDDEFEKNSDPNEMINDCDDLNYTDAYSDPSELLSLDEIVQKNTSRNIRDLREFFSSNNFVTEKGDQKANILDVAAKKPYYIPPSHIDAFFTLLDKCRLENRSLHYSERQETDTCQKSGIMIDFDRYQRANSAQIDGRHFDSLTRYIGKLLREFIEFEEFAFDDKFIFHIFYIRKPSVILCGDSEGLPLYKDGFHILIPEIQVIKGLKKYLCQELAARGCLKNAFKDIDHIDSPEKMLDKMSPSVPVYFLGGSKPGNTAYQLTHAYEVTFYTDEDDIDRKSLDVAPIIAGKIMMGKELIPINLTYELSLTQYSIIFGGQPTWLKKRQFNYRAAIEGRIQTVVEKTSGDIFTDEELRKDDEDISITNINNPKARYIFNLLKILDISYASDYEKWFKVMCAIAHSGITEDYKNIAREFSRRKPDRWSNVEFERVWSEATNGRFNRRPVTIRAIEFWARESAPKAFENIEKEHHNNILRREVYDNEGRVEHAAIAKLVAAMCGNKFVVDIGVNESTGKMGYCWYEFVTSGQAMKKGEIYKYRREIEPDNLHLFIGDHLPKVFAQVSDSIKKNKEDAQNENLLKFWVGIEKNFKLSKTKLGNDNFQKGIIKQAHYRFRVRGFYDELDSYEDIIGVGNGILKLGPEPQLIKGFHEYRISKFTDVDYVPFDPENPYIKTLLKAFRDIYPEEDVFEYMLMHASTGLDNRESACILTMQVGGGQNGKTFFAKITHNTLGNMYCAAGKPALVTSTFEKGGDANSAQMQQKGKRWFYIDEFNKCESLNTARIKSMVTPNWQSGRDVYEKQGNYKNTSNTMLLSNFDLGVDTTDHGTWRRVYYYENKMKFCKNPNPANPYEKKEDPRFIDEYCNSTPHKQAMLSLLTEYNARLWRKYGGDLKNVPVPTIERETEKFRNRQDAINLFITQMLVKSPSSDAIGLTTLSSKYIEWYNKNIKHTNYSISDVSAQFGNSRIATALERRLSGIMYLIGYRLKSYPEEPLMEGEEEMTVIARQTAAAANWPTDASAAVKAARAEDAKYDSFINDVQKNAPNYIQSREADQNIMAAHLESVENLDEILGML